MVERHKSVARVFVGTSPGGEDAEACAVLEYGLRSRSSVPVEITWLRLSRDINSPFYSNPRTGEGWQTDRWATPWTALRWAVPSLCNWQGRAIYFDCTSVIMGDVADLCSAEFPDQAFALVRSEGQIILSGCIVFDCAAAQHWVSQLGGLQSAGSHQAMGAVLIGNNTLIGPLPPGWGMRDTDYSRDPSAVTGSMVSAQPAFYPHARVDGPAQKRLKAVGRLHWFEGVRLPHYSEAVVRLFDAELEAAQNKGYNPERYVFADAWDYGLVAPRVEARLG